jgi:hypothetical protein
MKVLLELGLLELLQSQRRRKTAPAVAALLLVLFFFIRFVTLLFNLSNLAAEK